MILSDAVAAEDWEKVAVCANKIDEYARHLHLEIILHPPDNESPST